MADHRYPTLEEFWRRLEVRGVEPDLQEQLRERTRREERGVHRLPAAATVAVMARLLPGTIPPEALASFVDEHYDRQLGRANETVGLLPRDQLIPLGFRVLDEEAGHRHGRSFSDVAPETQDELLSEAERGSLEGPEGFDASTWFRLVRFLALLALGTDPRGMVFMGYPGPSYRTGHVWLDEREIGARVRRRRGYLKL